jgi:hypothetical protein
MTPNLNISQDKHIATKVALLKEEGECTNVGGPGTSITSHELC